MAYILWQFDCLFNTYKTLPTENASKLSLQLTPKRLLTNFHLN